MKSTTSERRVEIQKYYFQQLFGILRNYSLIIPNNRYFGVGTLVPFDETKVPAPKHPTVGSYFTSIPKELTMQVSLNIGKIDIYDADVASFIENKSVDEIKLLFINLLKNKISTKQSLDDNLNSRLKSLKVINPQRGKRVREALESLNVKLESIKDINIDEAKDNYFKEKFSL